VGLLVLQAVEYLTELPSATIRSHAEQATVICPSWFASPASHAVTGGFPSAMFTKVRRSSTVTWPSPLQSPTGAQPSQPSQQEAQGRLPEPKATSHLALKLPSF
jgi:hypothetical protein